MIRSKLSTLERRKRFLQLEALEPRLALAAEIEPNDSMATATLAPTNQDLTGKISRIGDQDYFKVNVNFGQSLYGSTSFTTATELLGGLEILDSTGRVLSRREGHGDARIIAPRSGTYYLRVSSQGSQGFITNRYSFRAGISDFWGTTEAEPNDVTPNSAPGYWDFRGSLATTSDIDSYSVNANAGQSINVDFFSLPSETPAVIVYRPDGTELGRGETGLGVQLTAPVSGAYRVAVVSSGTAASFTGEYVGHLEISSTDFTIPSSAVSFDTATPVAYSSPSDYAVLINGVLDAQSPLRVISFEIQTLDHAGFITDGVDAQRKVSIYNDRGQLLTWSVDLTLGTDDVLSGLTPGKYFASIEALNETGYGPFNLQLDRDLTRHLQRDTGLFFLDLNQQQSTHLGYSWISSFAVPQAGDFLQGLFDSRYAAYDAELTRTLPPAGTEFVSQGYGRFSGLTAGGQSLGGKPGQRRPEASTVTQCTMTTWTSFSWGCGTTMLHEYAHSTGLMHARNAQNLLGYDNLDEVFPAGNSYDFPYADPRIPTSYQSNPRDYLDWVLQPGRQVIEPEPNNTIATATALQGYIAEMQIDPRMGVGTDVTGLATEIKLLNINGDAWPDLVTALNSQNLINVQLATGPGVFGAAHTYSPGFALPGIGWSDYRNVLAVGDLNGDGRDDIAVAGRTSNTVVTYLSNADGTLSAPITTSAGNTPAAVEIRDLNGDGKADLVTANADAVVGVHLGNGDGTFQSRQQYATSGGVTRDVLIADVDGNGTLDILAGSEFSDVSLLRGNGNGTFQTRTTYSTWSADLLFLEEVNGDGNLDLVIGVGSVFRVSLGTGGGNFGPLVQQSQWNSGTLIAMGDMNGDGRSDGIKYIWDFPGIYVTLAQPDGSFAQPIPLTRSFNSTTAAVADLDGDGRKDILASDANRWLVQPFFGTPNDPRNDRAVVFGQITAPTDVDVYSFTATAGQTFAFDVEAAEFQRSLDSRLSVYDAAGNLLATNDNAMDRDTGISSVDPYLTHTFAAAGTYYVQVSSRQYTTGSYRLKLSPQSAWDTRGPRVIGLLPAGPTSIPRKQQFQIYFNDQIDPASLTAANVVVQGATSGVRTGSVTFDPFESALIWTGDAFLPPDTYTITLNGGAGGIRDLKGNLLDGETDGSFAFPEVSGNGTAGGNFVGSFTISSITATPTLNSILYSRDSMNRGQFRIMLGGDNVSIANPLLVARGAGPDALFNTADDRVLPLDTLQDAMTPGSAIFAYTRGIPDPDQYRIEGTVRGSSGGTLVLNSVVNVGVEVPETALFTNATLSQTGLVGSYVNSSLQSYAPQDDWRVTKTIAGTRVDPRIDFTPPIGWGARSEVGLTGGTDNNWNPFSVQWDGMLQVPVDNTRLLLKSTNGSRMWIDLNNDGVFDSSGNEFINNGWGTAGNSISGTISTNLSVGTYRIRVQYESTDGQAEQAYLEWITPDRAGADNGLGHGPSVIDTSIQPGSVLAAAGVNSFDVVFSGAINPATLTPANFKLRYSPDSTFYNGNDSYLTDADGVIAWNAAQHKATFQTQQPFVMGYYLVELNGDVGGIADTIGQRLDGEYLDSYIAGNTLAMHWQDTPSGDGAAGGDYIAAFSVVNFTVNVSVAPVSVSKDGSTNLVYTFTRTGDIESSSNVNFSVSGAAMFGTDYSQTGAATFNGTTGTITFTPGASTATLTIDPAADVNVEPDESLVIKITPDAKYNSGTSTVATAFINSDEPITFRVIGATATNTGVVVDFNRQLNPSTLNLYIGAADVTLVGATVGNVRGSLIVDPYLRRVTFVQTNGTLPPDTYTLTLSSNGVRDTLTSMLDGDADGIAGGNYVQQIVVAAPAANAVTVSVPNFARGPQQAMRVLPGSSSGIPLTLSNAAGITSATLQMNYDPALITINGATVAAGLPAGAAVSLNTSINGIATIEFTSPSALPTGVLNFVNLLGTVPANAPYRSKQVLDIANMALNGGAIPAIDDDGVHVVAYFGDVTANGTYSAQDASAVARLAVGLDGGLSLFKLLDPTIIADITGNGSFSASDTSRMLQAAVGIATPEIPPLPQPAVSLLAGGPDPKLSIPRNLAATAGQPLIIPVEIDSIVDLTGNGLTSADLVLYYDPLVIDVERASLGELLTSQRNWMISSRIDPIAGRIDLSLATTQPLEGQFLGELVKLHAMVRPDARGGPTAINLAATSRSRSTQLNEGFLTLIPAPTDAANDAIDGLVTITAASTPAGPSARLVDNRLLIIGTAADDRLLIKPIGDRSQVIIRANNRIVGLFPRPDSIAIDGLSGDDYIYVAPTAPTALIATTSKPGAAEDLIFASDRAQLVASPTVSTANPASGPGSAHSLHDLALLHLLDQLSGIEESSSSGGGLRRRR